MASGASAKDDPATGQGPGDTVDVYTFDDLKSVNEFQKGVLFAHGYTTISALKALTLEELKALNGLGEEASESLYQEIRDMEAKAAEELERRREEYMRFLKSLPDVTLSKAQRIINAGLDSFEKLAGATEEDLTGIEGIGRAQARKILDGLEERIEAFREGRSIEVDVGEGGEEPPTVATDTGQGSSGPTKGLGDMFKSILGKLKGIFGGKGGAEEDTKVKETAGTEGDEGVGAEVKEEEGAVVGGGETKPEEEAVEETGAVEGGEVEEEVDRGEGAEGEKESPGEQPLSEEPTPEPAEGGEEGFPVVSTAGSGGDGAVEEFMQIEGMTMEIARALYDAGYNSIDDLSMALPEDFTYVKGIDEETARSLHEKVRKYIESTKGE